MTSVGLGGESCFPLREKLLSSVTFLAEPKATLIAPSGRYNSSTE